MSLSIIANDKLTDKNTVHSYLPLYEEILKDYKETFKVVLEIGIFFGGSIQLWNDYFTNATIIGIDIMTKDNYINNNNYSIKILNNDKVNLLFETNAYDDNLIATIKEKYDKLDFVLDDGPHTLESMQYFVNRYSQLLSDNGILILEDIQDISWVNEIIKFIPDYLQDYVQVYDLRPNKNRYDDIVLVINKNKKVR
jgi:cephalosporin hydroxylase